jgi:hypothetical protein
MWSVGLCRKIAVSLVGGILIERKGVIIGVLVLD